MKSINEDIKSGNFRSLYLLFGPEAYLRKQYRDKLVSAIAGDTTNMNYHYFEGSDVNTGQIIDLAQTLPFLSEKRLIVIENSGLFKSGGEEFAAYLPEIPETTCIVMVEAEVDKRSKLYKAASGAGHVAEMKTQEEATLKQWVAGLLKKEGKEISARDLAYFIDMTGTDMGNIKKELEKLVCYCMDKPVITQEDLDAVCTRQLTGHVFDMVDAIGSRNPKRALELYYELLALKEPVFRIMALISRQFNLLLQVKELMSKGYGDNIIAQKTGINGYFIKKYRAQAAKFTSEELRMGLESCVQADEDIKTGKIQDKMSIELLIINSTFPPAKLV